MSLKDDVMTVRWNGSEYKVNRPAWNGGAVIPVEALREWLHGREAELNDELATEYLSGNEFKRVCREHALAEVKIVLTELEGL